MLHETASDSRKPTILNSPTRLLVRKEAAEGSSKAGIEVPSRFHVPDQVADVCFPGAASKWCGIET